MRKSLPFNFSLIVFKGSPCYSYIERRLLELNSTQLKKLVSVVNNTPDYNVFKLRTRRIVNNDAETALLWYIYLLGRNTEFFDEDVREHLYANKTYDELHAKYGTTIPSLRNKVYRQLKILDDIAPLDILQLKSDIQPQEVIEVLTSDIKALYERTPKIDVVLQDYFIVDLFTNRDITQDFSHVEDEDFLIARDIYARMSLPNINFLADNLQDVYKDYFAYLLTAPKRNLSEIDKQRRASTLAFLRLPLDD